MKRFKLFFLSSFFVFFFGELKTASFVWAGGGMSRHTEDKESEGNAPKKGVLQQALVRKVDPVLEEAFKNAANFHDRLSGYMSLGEKWRLQKEEDNTVLRIFYDDKEALVFTFLTDDAQIRGVRASVGKNLVPTINFLPLLPPKTHLPIDVFFKKIETDLNDMKRSSSVLKTFYMKHRSEEKDSDVAYEFLILNGPREALKIVYNPQVFSSELWKTVSLGD